VGKEFKKQTQQFKKQFKHIKKVHSIYLELEDGTYNPKIRCNVYNESAIFIMLITFFRALIDASGFTKDQLQYIVNEACEMEKDKDYEVQSLDESK
jgi:hypothetical protein